MRTTRLADAADPMHGGTQQLDAPASGAPTGDPGTTTRADRSGRPWPARSRAGRRPVLPSSRAVVGGLLVAVAVVAVYLGAAGAAHGPSRRAVVARHAIPIGHRLTADDVDVESIDVPAATAGQLFPSSAEVIGAVALAPLAEDELVGRAAVTPPDGDPPDTHAFSFPVDRERAVNGHLEPGETVDVLATFGTGDTAHTEVVARAVRLIDLEDAGEATIGSSGTVVVTLALTDPDQVLRAAHASEVAAVTLVRSDGSSATAAVGADRYPAGAGPGPGTGTP